MQVTAWIAAAPWALWLIAPLIVPIVVALFMWWRARPRRPATIPESIAGHHQFLQALGSAAGSLHPERLSDDA